LALTGGTTFIGADGVSPGTVNVEGPGDTLYLAGADTLDNATLNLGSSTYWYYGSNRLVGTDPAGQGAVQTLGPNLIIQQTGLAEINSDPSSGGVVNEGIILATAGQEFDIDGTAFTNTGFIDAENGTYLRIDPTSASNTGVITATGGYLILDNVDNSGMVSATGGSLTLDNVDNSGMVSVIDGSLTLDNVTNTGVISETNSTVNLMGSISLASLESLQLNGGWVTVTGTLDLGGGTLTVGAGSALSTLQLDWGTITNGTIIDQGGGGLSGHARSRRELGHRTDPGERYNGQRRRRHQPRHAERRGTQRHLVSVRRGHPG
jgi:hypothetical protein